MKSCSVYTSELYPRPNLSLYINFGLSLIACKMGSVDMVKDIMDRKNKPKARVGGMRNASSGGGDEKKLRRNTGLSIRRSPLECSIPCLTPATPERKTGKVSHFNRHRESIIGAGCTLILVGRRLLTEPAGGSGEVGVFGGVMRSNWRVLTQWPERWCTSGLRGRHSRNPEGNSWLSG